MFGSPFMKDSLMALIEPRKTRAGVTSYRARVRLKGHPEAAATFKRLTDAKRWVQHTESAMREGRHFKTTEAKRHTLADLVDRYVREVLPQKPKNAANTDHQLGWWKSKLGAYTLDEITAARIVQCRNDLLGTRTRRNRLMATATVVRYMAALSHALTVAVKDWEWMDDSPMRKVSKPREPRGRERFLSDDERTALLDACRDSTSVSLYAVVVLALSTGMRSGEIMGLRWPHVDLQRFQIRLHETKNGSSRAVPLAGHALAQVQDLARVRRIDTDLLFPGSDSTTPVDLRKPWKTAVRRANLLDFRFHDLRHSAASYMAMNGATHIDIAAILGHKTLQMVKRYSHLSTSHTSGVVSSMNAKIFGGRSNG